MNKFLLVVLNASMFLIAAANTAEQHRPVNKARERRAAKKPMLAGSTAISKIKVVF